MKKTIKLLKSDYKKFCSYIGNFNRILRKNGMKDIYYKMDDAQFPVYVHHLYDDGHHALRENEHERHTIMCDGYNVTIDIPESILKVGNCTYIGCMTYEDGIWAKHFVSPDNKLNDQICQENFRCDHCHAKINSRTGYLFYSDENGNLVVVGRKCARSYFGYNVEEIVKAISNFDVYIEVDGDCEEYDEDRFGFGSGNCSISLMQLIPIVAYYSHDFTKWEKKVEADMYAKATGTSVKTKNFVEAINDPSSNFDFGNIDIYVQKYCSILKELSEKVQNYWKNNTNGSDFAYNCRQIAERKYVSIRHVGYAAWLIFEALQVKQEQQNVECGEFVGKINERSIFELTVTDTREDYNAPEGIEYYNYRGRTEEDCFLKVYFSDGNGNHFQTNSHSDKMMNFFRENIGKLVKIKATVVRQFERKNGQKVNYITRCAIA